MSILEQLSPGGEQETIYSAPFGSEVLELVTFASAAKRSVMFVSADERKAQTAAELAEFIDPSIRIIKIAPWDNLPYDRVSPTPNAASRRCAALASLVHLQNNAPCFITTTSASLIQKCAPREMLQKASLALKPGEIIAPQDLDNFLIANGYTRVSTVRERGEYAQRGGIIDIFTPSQAEPVRLDFLVINWSRSEASILKHSEP